MKARDYQKSQRKFTQAPRACDVLHKGGMSLKLSIISHRPEDTYGLRLETTYTSNLVLQDT